MGRGKRSVAGVSERREGSGGIRTWEELADTGERLTVEGGVRRHQFTVRKEDNVGRKRHIYWTSVAGGVVNCRSTQGLHEMAERVLSGHEGI